MVSASVHLGDVWLLDESGDVAGLVRFRRQLLPELAALVESELDGMAGDWESAVRDRWLVGGRPGDGLHGGRLCCCLCGRALHHWRPGRLYGVECARHGHSVPDSSEVGDLSLSRWTTAAPRRGRALPPGCWTAPCLLRDLSILSVPSDFVLSVWDMVHLGDPFVRVRHDVPWGPGHSRAGVRSADYGGSRTRRLLDALAPA